RRWSRRRRSAERAPRRSAHWKAPWTLSRPSRFARSRNCRPSGPDEGERSMYEGTEIVHPVDALAQREDVQVVPVSAMSALAKSEVEAQLDAAHRYKRSVNRFLQEATGLATVTQEVAESCIYSIPRDGKQIAGPSVRLAEICASSYGNLHVAARIVDVEEDYVLAQGVARDLEKNL